MHVYTHLHEELDGGVVCWYSFSHKDYSWGTMSAMNSDDHKVYQIPVEKEYPCDSRHSR